MDSLSSERSERREQDADACPARSASPRILLLRLRRGQRTFWSITAIEALKRRGLRLAVAKNAVEAVMAHGFNVVELPDVPDPEALLGELRDAAFIPAYLDPPGFVDLAALRERLHLTREGFALAYGLDVESVRNWETGRRDPGPVRAYLQAIANDPVGVMEAYAGVAPRR